MVVLKFRRFPPGYGSETSPNRRRNSLGRQDLPQARPQDVRGTARNAAL